MLVGYIQSLHVHRFGVQLFYGLEKNKIFVTRGEKTIWFGFWFCVWEKNKILDFFVYGPGSGFFQVWVVCWLLKWGPAVGFFWIGGLYVWSEG